eukprot:m.115056 g.115056  ORF g.115056 m.115056 type:complete len:222 (-) comp14189_c0_seq1:3088-3753(-)
MFQSLTERFNESLTHLQDNVDGMIEDVLTPRSERDSEDDGTHDGSPPNTTSTPFHQDEYRLDLPSEQTAERGFRKPKTKSAKVPIAKLRSAEKVHALSAKTKQQLINASGPAAEIATLLLAEIEKIPAVQEDSQVKDMELEIEKQHTVILNLKNENSDLKKHAAERETKFRKLKLQARAKIKALANTGEGDSGDSMTDTNTSATATSNAEENDTDTNCARR